MKNKQRRQLVLIIFMSFHSITGYTQTYIGLTVGTNLLKVSSSLPFFPVDHNSVWDNKSLTLGIYVEHYLSNKIKLTLQNSFTSKHHDVGHVFAFNPITDIKYNMLSSAIFISWSPLNSFSINTGIGLSHLSRLRGNFALTEDVFSGEGGTNIFSGLIGASYRFRYFRLNLQYFHGLEFKDNFGFREFFTKFNLLEISLGYEIKILDKLGKKRKENCPRF